MTNIHKYEDNLLDLIFGDPPEILNPWTELCAGIDLPPRAVPQDGRTSLIFDDNWVDPDDDRPF